MNYSYDIRKKVHRKVKYFTVMWDEDNDVMIDNLNIHLNELEVSPEKILSIIDKRKYLVVFYYD